MSDIFIGTKGIGKAHPCYVIAEAGVNHNGQIDLALKLVDIAKDAGADAVKFQTFKAEKLVSTKADTAEYQKLATKEGETQFEMLSKLELSEKDHRVVFDYCREKGIEFLSTPFDEDSADFLESLGVRAFKIPSGEVTNNGLVEHIAKKGKPIVLSTGMSYLAEVSDAIEIIRKNGNSQLAVLHCVSNYPTDVKDVNLNAMKTMQDAFGVPVGFSDHTLGIDIAIAAVACGATIIEKHFTISHDLPGPDQALSLLPADLKAMIDSIRRVGLALGDGCKQPRECEKPIAEVARRSLHWRSSLAAGDVVRDGDLIALRPGTGMTPSRARALVGQPVVRATTNGALVAEDDFAKVSQGKTCFA